MSSLIFAWPCVSEETAEVAKIGVIAPLAGKGASWGESARQGIELALDEIREGGLLPKKRVEVVYSNVPFDKIAQGPAAFFRLVDVEKVTAIIGPMGSSVAAAVAPLVERAKIPVILHTTSAVGIAGASSYLFRLWPTSRNYASAMIPKLRSARFKRIASLTANYDNTISLLKIFKERIAEESLGIEFVYDERVDTDVYDFRSLLLRAKRSGAEALFLNLFVGQIGLAAKQARELGITIPIFAGPVLASKTELETGADSLEGAWAPRFSACSGSGIEDRFAGKYGAEPIQPESAISAHDAMLVLAEAIGSVGVDSAKIRDYIASHSFHGWAGKFSFSKDGEAELSASLIVVKGGRLVRVHQAESCNSLEDIAR